MRWENDIGVHGWVETCSEFERIECNSHVEIRHGSTYLKYVMAIWVRRGSVYQISYKGLEEYMAVLIKIDLNRERDLVEPGHGLA